MKKVLALLLAVMMIFSALSFSISAVTTSTGSYEISQLTKEKVETYRSNNVLKDDQVMLVFDAQSGTFYGKLNVYDNGFVEKDGVTGIYYMLPDNTKSVNTNLVPGYYVILPSIIAPVGKTFDGWYCYADGQMYAPGSRYSIPEGADAPELGAVEFVAFYSPAPVEKDIFSTILTKLVELLAGIIAPMLGMTEDEFSALVGGLLG